MTSPLRVLRSFCWAVVGTCLSIWLIYGTSNLIQLPWTGKAYILAMSGIAWGCIGKWWEDARCNDQLHCEDKATNSWEERESVMKGFGQSPPKHKGGGYQPTGGSEATPPKDE